MAEPITRLITDEEYAVALAELDLAGYITRTKEGKPRLNHEGLIYAFSRLLNMPAKERVTLIMFINQVKDPLENE